MHDSRFNPGRARRRLTLGIILVVIGLFILGSRLGIVMPYEWWAYWPWLLTIIGAMPLAVPGTFRERTAGYWILVTGIWGLVSMYEVLGLDWGNSWPIFIIAAGLKMLLSAIFCPKVEQIVVDSSQTKRNP